MSSPNPLISRTTEAVTIQLQGEPADKMAIYLSGTWGALETASVFLPTTTPAVAPGMQPYLDPLTGGAVVLSSGGPTMATLEGGYLYTIVKTVTAAGAGIDVQYKPRIGPH